MFAAVVSREQNAERRVVGLGRRNQFLPLLVLRRSSSAWRRAELFISERNVLAAPIGGENTPLMKFVH
jgi:hypothetical protein